MNTQRWIYISPTGSRNAVGVVHSTKLGYLIVYCDRKVVLAERSVFEPTIFTFFLDEELCQIVVLKDDKGQFVYQFNLDLKTNTPLNQQRRKTNTKHKNLSFLSFSLLFIFVALAMFFSFKIQDNKRWVALRDNGVLSVATVGITEIKAQKHIIFYTFRDSSQYIQSPLRNSKGKVRYFKIKNPTLENGFPIRENDRFLVTYASNKRQISRLHFSEPTATTVERYKVLAKKRYLKNNSGVSEEYCNCVLEIAYRLKGWKGLATLYHQKTPSKTNATFNYQTYQNLIHSSPFLKEEEDCWQFTF